MKVFSLANYKENIILPKEFKRLIPWRPDDLLQAEYDQENKTLTIYNLSERSLYVDKKTVNYSSVKLFEVKDYWNKLTGNEEFMTLELEKILRPIIITEHTSELRGEIKRAVINNHKILKGMKFAAFIKSRGLHERWFKNG